MKRIREFYDFIKIDFHINEKYLIINSEDFQIYHQEIKSLQIILFLFSIITS